MSKETNQPLKWAISEMKKCKKERDLISRLKNPITYTFLCGRISGLEDIVEKLSPPKRGSKKTPQPFFPDAPEGNGRQNQNNIG